MRKWMKGIVIAGVTLLFIGTAITALAAAVGNVQEKSYNSLAGYHFNFGVMKSIGNALRPGRVQIRDYDSDLEPEEDWDYSDEFNISEKNEMILVGSYTNIAKIEIEAERAAVKIVENPELTNEIRVYMKEDRYARIKTENDGPNELSVDYSFSYRGSSWSGRITGYTEGIVEIPSGYRFREAELKAKAGYMEAGAISADDLEAKVQAGEVRIGSFRASNAELTVEAGSITASGDFETYLETESKAGAVRVFLPGSDRDYNFYLENAVGNVVIGESVYSGLSNDKKINAQSGKTVKIDCAAGSAEIQFTGGN